MRGTLGLIEGRPANWPGPVAAERCKLGQPQLWLALAPGDMLREGRPVPHRPNLNPFHLIDRSYRPCPASASIQLHDCPASTPVTENQSPTNSTCSCVSSLAELLRALSEPHPHRMLSFLPSCLPPSSRGVHDAQSASLQLLPASFCSPQGPRAAGNACPPSIHPSILACLLESQ